MSYYSLISLMPKAPVGSLLLDTYSGAAVAYSLRKLRSAYTGSAIRVRRSSDDAVQDIGFVNNVLDTASLLSFVGAGSGFVTTWYDQSGNTKNATQVTTANQPRIVNAGVLDLVNGKAAILGDGSNDTLFNTTLSLSNPASIFTVVDKVGNTGIFGLITNLNRLGGAFSLTTTGYTFYQDGAVFSPAFVSNNQSLLVAKTATTGTDWEFYGNNTTVTNSGQDIGTRIGSRVDLFDRFAVASRCNMYMQEYIVWNSDQMTNRAGIQTEINTYYSIYVSDPDAQAFIDAAGITDNTQKSAINTLVVDLKGYNIWTKFKAIYPIVGGVASSHAVNLKTPGTHNLSFASGWTHSATGMLPNGATFADTNLNDNTILSLNSVHISYYSRTNENVAVIEMGVGLTDGLFIEARTSGISYYRVHSSSLLQHADSDSRAFYVANRTASNVMNAWKNGTKLATSTGASTTKQNFNIYIGALSNGGAASFPTNKQCAFASIGDGLTDTDAANFYTAVQAFQTTLGRSIGTQTVSDPDAQAFVTAANITDQVEANAVNNLVIGMKADSLWTKMKAIYPIVGGVASSHAVNLKTPGTFNLTFSSGWTHSANGMTPTNAYANTGFNPLTQSLPRNSASMGVYNRTNTVHAGGHGQRVSNNFEMFDPWSDNRVYAYINNGASGYNVAVLNSLGLFQASRTTSTAIAISQNNTINNSSFATTGDSNGDLWIGASNNGGTGTFFNNRQIAFFYIAEGFDNTEMQNIYTRVQAYQTTLNRQV